uniref:Uncharacterized protein n=1 Tax=virus sp. ctkyY8 TaxID=2827995 RepID=A0A8S5REQ2_9VIRU|nr:MAG TPA: hypothetical protein [virus sp. ctkyY8]
MEISSLSKLFCIIIIVDYLTMYRLLFPKLFRNEL